jgi:hypothetical protein
MPMCVEQAPPLFQTDPRRVTACYLYRDAPAIKPEELVSVFANGYQAQAAPRPEVQREGGAGGAGS